MNQEKDIGDDIYKVDDVSFFIIVLKFVLIKKKF